MIAVCPKGCHILGRWYILVLAIEIVLSAELTRSGFVTLLLSRPTVITRLCRANLFAPYWLACCACILTHVRARCVRALIILRSRRRRWRVKGLSTIVMCRAYRMAVAIGHMTIGAMLRIHTPWALVATMIHRWWLRLDVGTDTGSGALRLWHGSGLRSGGRSVGRDVVLRNVHRRRATGAMRAMTGRRNGPWIRVGAYIRGGQ